MPSTDPRTGKRLSGAAQAKRKKQAREHERQREADDASAFDSLPPPPITDASGTAELVTWGAQALALTMDRAMRRRAIFETERDQLRFVADCCAKLGMIRDKAAEQERIKKAVKAKKGERQAAGLDDVSQLPDPRVSRPPG